MQGIIESGTAGDEVVPAPERAQEPRQPHAGHGVLRSRVLESLLALSATAIMGQVANVVMTLLLARLLAPAEFGAIGVATLVISAFTLLRNAFVYQTLIQRSDRVREASDQMVIMAGALGLVSCVLGLLGAGWVANFFHAPDSAGVLRLLAVAFLIGSIGSVPATIFEKEMHFRRKMWIESAKPVVIAIVAVALAALRFGPSSVGWGELAGWTVWTLGIYRLAEYMPRPRWDLALLRQLMNYGRFVFGGAFLVFLFTNLDNASVARLLGPKALGYYSFAFILAYFPAMAITGGVVSSLLLPLYARIQQQRDAQAKALLSAVRYVSYYAAPICAATMLLGPICLRAAYGAKWAPGFASLQILALYGFAHSFFVVTRNLCNGVGRARWFWYISGLQIILVVPFVVEVTLGYGIAGTSLVFTVAKVVATIAAMAFTVRLTGLNWRTLVRPMLLPVGLAAIAGLAALGAGQLVPLPNGGHHWFWAIYEGTIFVVAYISLLALTDAPLVAEVTDLVNRVIPPHWLERIAGFAHSFRQQVTLADPH
jgi:O-antigen/teichoic acid export membrane protein